jgi:4-diphosphocytidyl-2-C-methyl-D-erythritol kinase
VSGVRISAPAKLNLRLLVGPRGDDGYHPLRTLMVALDGLADTVTVAAAAERRVTCPGIDGPRNLAWRALAELEREAGRPLPTAVVIGKRIPVQAGLGGGSSDAAAALVGADRIHGLGLGPARLERVAARVGSDVPFFVRAGAQWAEGRGERLRPASVPPFAALLAKPAAGLSTAAVYRAFDRLPPPPPPPRGDEIVAGSRNDPDQDEVVAGSSNDPYRHEVVARSRNDLWGAALALAPGLGATARALAAAGADRVLLCGSGSCLAGLFRNGAGAEEAAARMPAGGFRAVVTGPVAPRALVSG